MDVGARIKQLRIKNNLTQEELASRCELTKGFVSQVEDNVAVPSLPALMDIVEVLGTDMSQFFKEDELDEKVVFTANDFFEKQEDGYTIKWIVPNAQKNEMEPIVIELKPGCCSNVMEPHEGEEFGYVLSGTVVLVNGDSSYVVKKGNTFYIHGEHQHYLRNNSQQPAKVLWITTPPLF